MAISVLKRSQIDVRTCREYNLGVEMTFGLVDDVLTLVDNDSTILYTRENAWDWV